MAITRDQEPMIEQDDLELEYEDDGSQGAADTASPDPMLLLEEVDRIQASFAQAKAQVIARRPFQDSDADSIDPACFRLSGGPFSFDAYEQWSEDGSAGPWGTRFTSLPDSDIGYVHLCGDPSEVHESMSTYLSSLVDAVLLEGLPMPPATPLLPLIFRRWFVLPTASKRFIKSITEAGRVVLVSQEADFTYQSRYSSLQLSFAGEIAVTNESHEDCFEENVKWRLGSGELPGAALAFVLKIQRRGAGAFMDPYITLYIGKGDEKVKALACGRGSLISPFDFTGVKTLALAGSQASTAAAGSSPPRQPDPSDSAQRAADLVEWVDLPADGTLTLPLGEALFGDVKLEDIPGELNVDAAWLGRAQALEWSIDLRQLRSAVLQACADERESNVARNRVSSSSP